MPYLFSWSPDRITPTQTAQISVWDHTNAPATLSAPVTVVSGLVSFSVPTTGSYRVSVRSGYEIETGTFTITGDGTASNKPDGTERGPQAPIHELREIA
jgi:hypothetical protein